MPTLHPEFYTTLLLLLAGHVLAEFVFQTKGMVQEKGSGGTMLLLHGLVVFLVQCAVVIPFQFDLGISILVVLMIAVVHMGVDRLKSCLEAKWGPRISWFLMDQALHLLSILGALLAWNAWRPIEQLCPVSGPVLWIHSGCALAIAYGLAIHGGNAIVSTLLLNLRNPSDLSQVKPEEGGAGKLIGILERLIIVTLVWQGEWGAMGFVLAGKSIARFKELEDKSFAETYLVGTLTSFLVAGALGGFLQWMIPPG